MKLRLFKHVVIGELCILPTMLSLADNALKILEFYKHENLIKVF